MPAELIGIIRVYLPEKGYGYIRLPDTHEEFFFKQQNLREAVSRGDFVRFVLRHGAQGWYADEIYLASFT